MTISKKLILITGLVALAVGGTLVVMADRASAQARPFSERSVQGTYYFNFVQIRVEEDGGVLTWQFCEEYGEATFYGNGAGMVAEHPKRCIPLGGGEARYNPTEGPSNFTYQVDDNGSLTIVDPNEPTMPFHGRVLNNGSLVLLDGTTLPLPVPPDADPVPNGTVVIHHGVAAKR